MAPEPPDHAEPHVITTQTPPTTTVGILRRLGPGLIIAGSIVGSGELIATTKVGAEAGFVLLWLIIIGCVIKVFAQVEFGRYAINTGKTALDGMNEVPGPRLGVNWLVWYWVIVFIFSTAQLGGIVGGVGEALSITMPLTGDYKWTVLIRERAEEAKAIRARFTDREPDLDSADTSLREAAQARVREPVLAQLLTEQGPPPPHPRTGESYEFDQELPATRDNVYWAAIITAITVALLVGGRYTLVQSISLALVASFTFVSVVNLIALQWKPDWAIHWDQIVSGLKFGLPAASKEKSGVASALSAFGIIGVGAIELIAYPYWCLEKGYARYTGPRDDSPEWAERARGWLRVLRWDAWCSMTIYTFCTLVFFLLGASVLHAKGLDPGDNQLIYVLSQMYVDAFGDWAQILFLFGAFAVLYSTFFVASAGNARIIADNLRVIGLIEHSEKNYTKWTRICCAAFPIASLVIYTFIQAPTTLVLASGLVQAIMLPMLGAAALFFRYRRCDRRIMPSIAWDVMLWISCSGLLLAGGWAAWGKVHDLVLKLTSG